MTVVHVLISPSAQLLGLFTSGVDCHEVQKLHPGSQVTRMRLNQHIPPCQHTYEADDRWENERRTCTCTKCGDVM
eukprot:SAG25_NODE_946_length_4635_cov_4.212963_5_plen_75_part_00